VVAHAFNSSTREAETSEFLSSRPAWSTVPGQPGLHRETLSQKTKKKKKRKKERKKEEEEEEEESTVLIFKLIQRKITVGYQCHSIRMTIIKNDRD
jgi:ribosomal protein L12E/L44/L45/RPP1/RPP2